MQVYDGRFFGPEYRTTIRRPHRPHRTSPASSAGPFRGAPGVAGRLRLAASRSWLASNRSQVMYAGSRSRISTRHSSGRRISLPVVGRPGCFFRGSIGRCPYRYAPA